jgi:hypothetical protein
MVSMNFKFSLKWPFIILSDSLCQCGRYKKCVRKVNVSSSGRVWIDSTILVVVR